jgi:hypothetical protein
MMALMQLLPSFEKHSPGIKFLSRADPIIHFAKMTLLIQLKFLQEGISPVIFGQNYCQLSSPVA